MKWLWSLLGAVFVALVSTLAIVLHHSQAAPPADLTPLRLDLVAMDQALTDGISQTFGLRQLAGFAAAVKRLETDYNMQSNRLDSECRSAIEANIIGGRYLSASARQFVPYASPEVAHDAGIPRQRWESLQRAYALVTRTNALSGSVPANTARFLESKEHTRAP